jgi:hypothetical protein
MATTDRSKFSRYRFRYFDRDAEFVVLRSIRVGGRDLRPGDAFDKSMTTLRMHKVLFQQRKIDEVGGCWHKISGLPNPYPPKVEFKVKPITDVPFALPEDEPPIVLKRKGGRPKGSKNKPKEI